MGASRFLVWPVVLLSCWTSLGCGTFGRFLSTPGKSFDHAAVPAAPDYWEDDSWAALPWKESRADSVPRDSDLVDAQDDALADVFYVHATSYFWRSHWNAPVGGWLTNIITNAMMAGQVSAFNGSARIYAPRYRQMTLAGFDDQEVRDVALSVAYEDVRSAFLHYVSQWSEGRPLILVGHSQGSRHLDRLLHEFFVDGPLADRLVAAYIPGAKLGGGPYDRGEVRVPICEAPEQTGCLVGWRTFANGADPSLDDNPGEVIDGDPICVNPLSWRRDEAPVAASENLGAIGLPMLRGPGPLRPDATGARCEAGVLWIEPVEGWGFGSNHDDGNWHAYDFPLFYMNVRENAARRLDAFLRAREVESSESTPEPSVP